MRPLGAKGPALVLVAAGGNRDAAMGRFRNAPHDVVVAIAEQIGGAWKITDCGRSSSTDRVPATFFPRPKVSPPIGQGPIAQGPIHPVSTDV